MARTKWIRPNNHLVQYLVISKGSHLKIRIFSSKQQHSPRSQYMLQHILHVYYRSQWIFFTSVFLRQHSDRSNITHKGISQVKCRFCKVPFHSGSVVQCGSKQPAALSCSSPPNDLFLQKLWVVLQLTSGTRQIFFQTMRLHFSYPSGYFRDTEPSA